MTGRINSIQSLGTLDGPGVRFVVFVQGCPLRCAYCHNPDTWDFSKGDEYTPQQIFEKALRYKSYFKSNGGITVSGGEPLMQADFVRELFSLCKKEGIHTCLDTGGGMWNDKIDRLLDVTDLCMLDVKMTNENDYEKYINWEMKPVLYFLGKLDEKGIDTWIRQVIVGGINDDKENILSLKAICEPHKNIKKIELLPFRKFCTVKYDNLKIDFPLKDYPETSPETIDRLSAYI